VEGGWGESSSTRVESSRVAMEGGFYVLCYWVGVLCVFKKIRRKQLSNLSFLRYM